MVGKKVVMGVTGLIGIGFVILHSLGNLLVRGPEVSTRTRGPQKRARGWGR